MIRAQRAEGRGQKIAAGLRGTGSYALCALLSALCFCAVPSQNAPTARAVSLFPSGERPVATVAADFDGDGVTDIATADGGSNTVSILRGTGQARFDAPRAWAAHDAPHLLRTADFNGDRRPDLAVSSHDSDDIVLLINTGKGFRRLLVPVFQSAKGHNHGLAAADLNGDGNLDLAVSHQDLSQMAVLLGDGRAGFRPAPGSPFATGQSPYPHVVADVNGDRRLDVVAPAVAGNSITVLIGKGDGSFAAGIAADTGISRPYGVGSADFNGDGHLDLVVTHDDTSRIALMAGDGKGSFRQAPGSPVDAGKRGGSAVITGDFNRDGHLDAAMAGSGMIQQLHGDGTGRLTRATTLSLAGDAWHVTAADLNADGQLDFIAPVPERNAVEVFLGGRN